MSQAAADPLRWLPLTEDGISQTLLANSWLATGDNVQGCSGIHWGALPDSSYRSVRSAVVGCATTWKPKPRGSCPLLFLPAHKLLLHTPQNEEDPEKRERFRGTMEALFPGAGQITESNHHHCSLQAAALPGGWLPGPGLSNTGQRAEGATENPAKPNPLPHSHTIHAGCLGVKPR